MQILYKNCKSKFQPLSLVRQNVNDLRPIHTRDFAPGACSRGTLREQISSVCTNDFMGTLHTREQNCHPAKRSTIFNRLRPIHTRVFAPEACSRLILHVSEHKRERFQVRSIYPGVLLPNI